MNARAHVTELRTAVLAVSVLDDVDLEPADDGVRLPGPTTLVLRWQDLAIAHDGADRDGHVARHRLALTLRLAARLAAADVDPQVTLRARAVAVALPVGHADHLGGSWVRDRVPGGVLDLGTGLLGALDDPDAVVPLPPAVARAAGLDVAAAWPDVRAHAERMSSLAARLHLRPGLNRQVLRPVGGVDVLTLLAAGPLRAALAEGDGTGLRAVAVPTRSRGWFDLARIDPAFVGAAWALTPQAERGLARPLLVTRDEVVLPREGGDPALVAREHRVPGDD